MNDTERELTILLRRATAGRSFLQNIDLTIDGLTTWNISDIKTALALSKDFPVNLRRTKPHNLFITSQNIEDLRNYYTYFASQSRGRDGGETYVSTNIVYIFKLVGQKTKPALVLQQVKVQGGDGAKFFIATYADTNITGFSPVQVIPV